MSKLVQRGGPDHVIEAGNRPFGERQHNRGHMIQEQQWVFGRINRQPQYYFTVLANRGNAHKLLLIISQFILPRMTILSDRRHVYTFLRNNLDFIHQTVNHFVNFVDATIGIHIQNI